jgi:hypothetical protein
MDLLSWSIKGYTAFTPLPSRSPATESHYRRQFAFTTFYSGLLRYKIKSYIPTLSDVAVGYMATVPFQVTELQGVLQWHNIAATVPLGHRNTNSKQQKTSEGDQSEHQS